MSVEQILTKRIYELYDWCEEQRSFNLVKFDEDGDIEYAATANTFKAIQDKLENILRIPLTEVYSIEPGEPLFNSNLEFKEAYLKAAQDLHETN